MNQAGVIHRSVPWRVGLAILAAAAVSLLSVVVVPKTLGIFSSQTTNAGNAFSTGTLLQTNSLCIGTPTPAGCQFIVTLSNMKPGDATGGCVTVTNTGTLAAIMNLSELNITHGGTGTGNLASQLQLTISDVTSVGSVACNTTSVMAGGGVFQLYGTASAGAAFNGATGPISLCTDSTCASHTWAPNESHRYQFFVSLPLSSDNTFQGTNASADFQFAGTSS